ncbi:hypothetical protein BVER_02389 [Candidatus Burkholderia verschuerenii]|uniref:Retrotransposon gag domain-containing protein n=2 Tax=Candidatus Burkholderia verschuerenii TaxID=242163 RepID=A0A0L0M286_9BURK|nr:hypothetical protein BVER_02389 [Candidatus Burkholderia verschuerenii]
MKRMLFPFSLQARAKEWYRSQASTIATYDELIRKFIAKYFSPDRVERLRQEVMKFEQQVGESFADAWERFQDLVQRCPNLMLEDGYEVQVFYNGLTLETQLNVNASAGGSLQDMTFDQVRTLFDKIAANGCRSRGNQRRQAGLMEVSPTIGIEAQLAAMTKKMEKLEASFPSGSDQDWRPTCGVCKGPHFNDQCPQVQENCNAVGNFQRGNQGGWNNQAQGGNYQGRQQGWNNQGSQGPTNNQWRGQWNNHGQQEGQNSNWNSTQGVMQPVDNSETSTIIRMLTEMREDNKNAFKRVDNRIDEQGRLIGEQGKAIQELQRKVNARPQ